MKMNTNDAVKKADRSSISFLLTEQEEKIERFYTVPEIAPQIGMSEQGLYAACREGQFPHVRIGKRIRIPASAVSRWVEQQLRGSLSTERSVS
jgi:excisionase family DNA binding protein